MASWEYLASLVVLMLHLMLNVQGVLGLSQHIPATSEQRLDDQLMRFMEEHGYSGASLGVVKEGKLVYMKAHGETSPTLPFPISSVCDVLTAAAVMRLVEEDRVRLQDRVFGPDGILRFPAAQDLQLYDPRILDITVLHLMHHTAGWENKKRSTQFHLAPSLHLSSHPNDSKVTSDVGDLADQLVQVVQPSSLDLTSDPGTSFHLSDKDELLLRKVIEVSGQTYKDFVSEQVLEPLGMWATQLRPGQTTKSQKKLLFEEGEILVDRPTSELIPTTETWYSTVPDLLHLVQAVGGYTSSGLLKKETVKKMLEKPELPMPQHVEMWHGAGMQVNNNGTWWKGGGSEGVHVMVFCDGQHRLTRNQNIALYGHADPPVKQGICWVICLHGNNPISPPIRRQLANMIHTCTTELPKKDLFIQGYTDMVTELKSGKLVALKHGIPDDHMKAYLNGIHGLGYEVQWVSAYNVQNKAHFAVILRKGKHNGTSQMVGLYPSTKQLSKAVSELETKGYHVDFLTSYTGESCHKVCYVVTFVHKPTRDLQQTKVKWEKTLDKYEDDRRDKITAGYVISMQSVVSVHDQLYLSYILEKQKDVLKTAVYTRLTLSELQTAIHTNGLSEKTLAHLDPYKTSDGTRFSAVFNTNRYGKWTFHGKLTKELLKQEMGRSARLGYEPSIFVGYEEEGEIYYAVMWILPQ